MTTPEQPSSKSAVPQAADTSKGAAYYWPWFLRFYYNRVILGVYCPYAWGCAANPTLRQFFNSGLPSDRSLRILDVGVGTGYYLENAELQAGSSVALVDLNTNSLDLASSRIRKKHPGVDCLTTEADFYRAEDMAAEKLGAGYDCISLMFLLHCLPGPPSRKAEAVVRLRSLLAADGVLLGSTILGKDVVHNRFGRFIMTWHNSWGIFGNADDDIKSLVVPLEEAFEEVEWRIEGRVLLFQARRPRLE